eukprot:symbB.v1.2.020053.t3/scaffold1665.1/size106850/14
MEIRQGPERRSHDIEAGSMVLAAIVIGEGQTTLLSWRVGEGAVPGFMDVAVASMRFCESAAFEASEVVQTCPTYEGQTPLRSLELNELKPWLIDSLKEEEVSPGASPPVLLRRYCRFPWTGQSLVTSKAGMTFNCRKMAVSSLPPTEAVDLCLLEEDGQLHFLELERAHGNAWVLPKALAKVGRFEEAAEAYRRALDAVRRSSFYKALFPTERGHIQGAYSREAIEGENPLEKLSPEEVSMRRGQLVALHLNLSLCATKAGLFALARRHAETALGTILRNCIGLLDLCILGLRHARNSVMLLVDAEAQSRLEQGDEDARFLLGVEVPDSWKGGPEENSTADAGLEIMALHLRRAFFRIPSLGRTFASRVDSRALKEEQIALGQERIFGPRGSMPGDRQLRKKLEGRKLMRWYFPSKYNLQDFRNEEYFEMQAERFAPRVKHESMEHLAATLKKVLRHREELRKFFQKLDEATFMSNPTIQDLYGCFRLISEDRALSFEPDEKVFKAHSPFTSTLEGVPISMDIENQDKAEKKRLEMLQTPHLQSYMNRRHRFIDPMFRRRRLKWLERQAAGLNKEWNVKHRLPFYGTHPDDLKQWPTSKAGLHVALSLKRNLGLEAVAIFAVDRGAPHLPLYSDEGYKLLCEDEPLEFFEGFNPVVYKLMQRADRHENKDTQRMIKMWTNDCRLCQEHLWPEGAEPENAKALFRRGQAAAGQGDYEDALKDLQKAAELMPQDRGIRSEIQAVQRDLRVHREAQKNMFVNVFQPPNRAQGEKQTRAFAMKKGHEACQCVDGKHVSKIAYSDRCFFAQAYDSGRKAKKSLESQSSVELGLDDFETQVLRSNEVWFVQAYDPNDGGCKSFATGWEDVAHTYGEHARFGRLDVSKAELKGVVLQLLGSELGDKALFHLQHPTSAESIARASELAQEGKLACECPKFWQPDRHRGVVAPEEDLRRVIAAVKKALQTRSLIGIDTEPLPRFEDSLAFVTYLEQLSEQIQASELVDCCKKMATQMRDAGRIDLNDGNVLCSPDSSKTWQLDALIDWEGAAVVDARVAYENSEPWQSLRTLAKVVKIRWMMAAMAGTAQSLLPFKPVLLPVVFRYARGMSVEHWMFSERMARQEDNAGGGKALMNFMEGNFPEFHRHNDASELKRWWSVEEPRILMVGPSSSSLAAKAKDFMPVFRMAHVWEEFFNVASADAQAMVEVLGSDYAFDRGQTWALILRGSDGAVSKEHVRNVRDMAPLIQDFISEEITRQAPVATLRNYQQLCGDSALTQGTSKTYCLILVDASVDETAKALRELESSRKAYYQEVQELRNAGEDSEEPFRIQPVRVASSSSRLPWKPAAPGSSFAAVWAEASKARAFILEMESRKYAAVKTPSLNEIFQSIAYEDLKLEELHEDGPPLSRLFSDPETTLRREVSAFLSTTICAYVLVALVVSVAPELELLQLAVPLVVLVVVLMLASPTLNRKVISIFWCTLRSSSMECQRNF